MAWTARRRVSHVFVRLLRYEASIAVARREAFGWCLHLSEPVLTWSTFSIWVFPHAHGLKSLLRRSLMEKAAGTDANAL